MVLNRGMPPDAVVEHLDIFEHNLLCLITIQRALLVNIRRAPTSIIKASDVEWLIVRPGFLTNGPRTGKYRAIENLSGVTAGKISRADVADFILKQLTKPTHFRKTPLLTYSISISLMI